MLALLSLPLAAFAADNGKPVSIVLHPEARISSDIVRLGDLGDIHGGSGVVLRQRIAELDVAKVETDQPIEITRSQIQIRLALADIPTNTFSLRGSERVLIVPQRVEIGEAEIAKAIKEKLAKQYSVDEQDVDVRLVQPNGPIALAGARPDEVRLEALLPLNSSLGTIRTQVLVHVGTELRKTLTVPVATAVYLEVARARNRIARGETFTPENMATERYRMRYPRGIVTAADVLGRVARRTVQTGDVIREYDIDDEGPDKNPVLINVRDPVRVVARKGGLTVILHAAEALEQGHEGELIRVRNAKSKKILTARVVSDSEVHVAF